MGNCSSSKDSDLESVNSNELHQQQQQQQQKLKQQQQQQQMLQTKKKNTAKGVGLGVAMMMQQATQMSAGSRPIAASIDLTNLRNEMRKAKAEGRTVTVINGCVYFDYQFVAQLPPNCNFVI